MIRGSLSFSLCIALLAVLGSTAEAQSSMRVTVMRFDGPGATAVRRHVVRGLEGEADLAPQSAFRELADSLGEDLSSDESVGRVASQMGLTLVIRGSIEGRGRRARLTLWAVDAMGVQLGTEDGGRPAGRAGRRRALEAAQALLFQAQQAIEERARLHAQRLREQQAAEEARRLEEEEAEAEAEAGDQPWLRLRLGAGGRSRQATINTVPSARVYDAPLLAEIITSAELYPFAGQEGGKAGLFFAIRFANSLGARSIDPTAGTEVETSAMRFGLDLGYLAEVESIGARMGGTLGFHLDSFTLGPNSVLESSSYSQLRLGVRADFPIMPLFQLGLEAGFRYALSIGDFAGAYGDQGSAIGVDIGANISGDFEMGLGYLVSIGYLFHSLSFAGTPAIAMATDGSDSALLLGVQLGYAFR